MNNKQLIEEIITSIRFDVGTPTLSVDKKILRHFKGNKRIRIKKAKRITLNLIRLAVENSKQKGSVLYDSNKID